jgi:hypothetical protein
MKNNLRIGRALLATLLSCSLWACTTQEANQGGSGGSGGGTEPPLGTGGTTTPGGTGGSTSAAGCPTVMPALITDFATGTAPDATNMRFGGSGLLSGGGSVWGGLTSEIVQGAWHISGTVIDYAGLNLYIDNCSPWNASAFKGISFTISGTAANQATPLTFGAPTIEDTPSAAWLISKGDTQAKATDLGSCTPSSGNGRYYHPGCNDPTKSVAVPTVATPINVLWTDFSGGQPSATPKPDQITGIYFNLSWGGTGSATYPADFTIDDLKFIE